MINYETGKIILKFPPICQFSDEYQEWDITKQMFQKNQKGGKFKRFKIFFSVPYPIIYNHGIRKFQWTNFVWVVC